ncbi:hypothetical protein [Pyruvatibacter mobilis]|uniref:hypothetical protein n=1 Tax=Pyruvatibacter mobilis TaxID=1712261 RepID=UPI003BAABFEC
MPLLCIGTTGMLAGAARQLAGSGGADIAVLARRASAFRFGETALDRRRTAYDTDWNDAVGFVSALEQAGAAHGPFRSALVWMHGRDEALRAQIVHHMAEDGLLIEVLGSAASRPGAFGEERVRVMQGLPHIRYRQVLLGFVHDDGVSRWLTHEEICAGVLRAAAGDDVVTVAGQVEPWKLRP